jgi:hypothetical protein
MAAQFVNVANGGGTGSSSTSVTGAQYHQAGNLLVACIASGTNTVRNVSVTDTIGNVWVRCAGSLETTQATAGNVEHWYTVCVTTHSANVVTATRSASDTFHSIWVSQFWDACPNRAEVYEVGAVGSVASATTCTSNAFVPAAAGNICVSGCNTGAAVATWTPDTNYYLAGSTQGASGTLDREQEYRPNAPAGSQTAAITIDTATAINISVASFRSATHPDRYGTGNARRLYRRFPISED